MSETPPHSLVKNSSWPVLVAFSAWLVPGLGHLLLGRRGRALVCFLAVGTLAVTGYWLRGNVFQLRANDLRSEPFNLLGALADLGSGIFYFLAKLFESAGPNVSRAAGDDGTRFIATAGVVNLLCVLDAYGIATGKKD